MTSHLTIHEMVLQRDRARRPREAEQTYRSDEMLGASTQIGFLMATARRAVGAALICSGEWMREQFGAAAPLSAPQPAR